MGYFGKLEEKQLAQQLRRKGLSYGEIQKKVHISKDSLSRWCRDIILTAQHMERLQKRKLKGAERGRIIGAKRQQQNRIKRINSLLEKGKKEVGKLTKRDRFIAGAALYLGDGYKSDKSVGFSNSDPKIIKFMMSWFREFCRIPEEKFRGQIWIHDNRDELKARKYWSKITGIPLSRFHKSYIAKNKIKSRKIRKQLHKCGIFAIRISSAGVQRRILGWMSGILENSVV
ncbi:MAG: hypothetical protein NT135_01750 [Candidatus Berkelbacteria bacterium]|nr:hypothetical protein [Candidatus Berkelbacteria bacterium]